MARIQTVDPSAAQGKAKDLLDNVNKALGVTPNMMRAMASSPATLGAYLGFGQALGGGSLPARVREQIALTVAGVNRCNYCASAHTALASQLGLPAEELEANLEGESGDDKTNAILVLAKQIVEKRGFVSDDDLAEARGAGIGDGEIAEIVGNVALNIFTNYFNHVAQPEVDFPLVDAGEPALA